MTNAIDTDDEHTVEITPRSMAALMYGVRPARRPRFRGVVALAVAILAGAAGCHATTHAPEAETVGTLSASYNSVASAPVHETTNLTVGFQAIDSDEGTAASGTGEAVEAPMVVSKGGGLVMKEVR